MKLKDFASSELLPSDLPVLLTYKLCYKQDNRRRYRRFSH